MNTEGWGQTLCANKTGCAGLDEPVTGTRGKLESGEFKQQKVEQFVGGKVEASAHSCVCGPFTPPDVIDQSSDQL